MDRHLLHLTIQHAHLYLIESELLKSTWSVYMVSIGCYFNARNLLFFLSTFHASQWSDVIMIQTSARSLTGNGYDSRVCLGLRLSTIFPDIPTPFAYTRQSFSLQALVLFQLIIDSRSFRPRFVPSFINFRSFRNWIPISCRSDAVLLATIL